MNTLKKFFQDNGLTAMEVSKLGIPYNTIIKHLSGERCVGPKTAIKYEQAIGIKRWELRPDIWEQPTKNAVTR